MVRQSWLFVSLVLSLFLSRPSFADVKDDWDIITKPYDEKIIFRLMVPQISRYYTKISVKPPGGTGVARFAWRARREVHAELSPWALTECQRRFTNAIEVEGVPTDVWVTAEFQQVTYMCSAGKKPTGIGGSVKVPLIKAPLAR